MRYLSLAFALLLSGCSFVQSGEILISVKNIENKSLSGAQIAIYNEEENGHKKHIITLLADDDGCVHFPMRFSDLKSIRIDVQMNGLDHIFLAQQLSVSVPKWWQDQFLSVQVKLKELKPSKVAKTISQEVKNLTEEQIVAQVRLGRDESVATIKYVEDIENDLEANIKIEKEKVPETEKKPITDKSPRLINPVSSFSPKLATIINQPMLKTVFPTNRKKQNNILTTYEITSNNKAISGVKVFAIRNATQSFYPLGESNENGMIELKIPSSFKPDLFYFQKEGYIGETKPFLIGHNNQPISVSLKVGKSIALLMQSYLYGSAYGLEKNILMIKDLKTDSSGASGLFIIPNEPDKEVEVRLSDSLLDRVSNIEIQERLKSSDLTSPQVFFVPTKLTHKPIVGLLELEDENQYNMNWRRFRREFFSRFMNEPTIRTRISDEIRNFADFEQKDPFDFMQSGWKNSSYATELDLLIELNLKSQDLEKNSYIAQAIIVNKFGQKIFEKEINFQEKNSEVMGVDLFNQVVSALPFECFVTKHEKDFFVISLGKEQHIKVGDNFVAYISKIPFGIPDEVVGVLKVDKLTDNTATLSKNILLKNIDKEKMIRLIRLPENFIEKEIKRKFALKETF